MPIIALELLAAALLQAAPPVPVPAATDLAAPSPALPAIPILTPVEIEILTDINTRTAQRGALFPIRLAKAIQIDGVDSIAAGATGVGEIVHSAKARAAGKAGELILAARYIDADGTHIPLRSLHFGARGKDNRDIAFAVGASVGIVAFLISGGEVDVPAGTHAIALTSAAVPYPHGGSSLPATDPLKP